MFDVDFNDIVNKIIPFRLQSVRNRELLYAMIKPLKTIHTAFVLLRNAINYKLLFNAQIIYLEHYLNDIYDPINRGIFIEDTADINYKYLFNKNENRPNYIYNKSENKPPYYLYNKIEYGSIVEYIVMIPTGVAFFELIIRNQINYYNQAGKRYRIETY